MMGQFIFGLFAGIIVGLVMEWVIDWAGLIPKGAMVKRMPKKREQTAETPSATQGDDQQSAGKVAPRSPSNQTTSGE